MQNSNYDLELKAEVDYLDETYTITFDPYNDCTDMDELRQLAIEEVKNQVEGEIDEDKVAVTIVDYEDAPTRYANETDIWAYAEAFANSNYKIEVIEAASQCGVDIADINEAYQGVYKSDEDFAREMADWAGAVDSDAKWPMGCIDWEQAAEELMYDYISSHDSHYFRCL